MTVQMKKIIKETRSSKHVEEDESDGDSLELSKEESLEEVYKG